MKKNSNSASGPSDEDMRKWQAESDLWTLVDAEKIKADKARLKAAMACRAEQQKALASLETKK